MRKILQSIILIGIVAIATPVFSQKDGHQGHQKGEGGGKGGHGHEPDYAKLKTDLTLTDAQVTQWKALDQKYKTQLDAVRSNSSLSETDKRTQHKQIQDAKETELKTIITDAQYTTYTKNRPQRH